MPRANAYVPNTGDGTVSVINTMTNAVVATIPAVNLLPIGVAVTQDGSKVYAANDEPEGTVSVMDTATNAVRATVPVGSAPIAFGVFIQRHSRHQDLRGHLESQTATARAFPH